MNEGELRATLVDLVAKHNEQVESVEDFEETVESLESDRDSFKEDSEAAVAFFSELVGAQKDMDPELLAEKFTATELREQVDMDAFSLETDDEDDTDDPTFADKPERSDNLPGEDDVAKYRDEARAALERMGVAAFDN